MFLFRLLLPVFVSVTMASTRIFPTSTEIQLAHIQPFLDEAPPGLCVTVGGERALREASLFKGITRLVVLDISPDILRYITINMKLLRTPHRETYRNLRWEASFLDWKKANPTLTQEDFDWWDVRVRKNEDYPAPEYLNRHNSMIYQRNYLLIRQKLRGLYPKIAHVFNNQEREFLKNISWEEIESLQKESNGPLTKKEFDWFDSGRKKDNSCLSLLIKNPSHAVDVADLLDYKSGNYLFDDRLYQRLHQLVLQNKITLLQADLTNSADMERVVRTLRNFKSKIAVLDLNNLFDDNYMGEEKFRLALGQLLPLGTKQSILILMRNHKEYACTQFSVYIGFTFENVNAWPQGLFLNFFFTKAPPEAISLLNRRLYTTKEMLPLYLQ